MDKNVDESLTTVKDLAPFPLATLAFVGEAAHHRHGHTTLAMLGAAEGVLGDVALPSLAKRLGSSLLAANGAGNNSRNVVLKQILIERDAGKAAVEVEAADCDALSSYLLCQPRHQLC